MPATASLTADTDQAERELSDAFWNAYVRSTPYPDFREWWFQSVEDMADAAHLVVVGRIAEVYVGEMWVGHPDFPSDPFAYARIAVDEVFNGEPVSREPGSIEQQLGLVGTAWEPPEATDIPHGRALFFLMHEATYLEGREQPPRTSDIAPFAYFDPAPESVMRDIGGLVRIVEPDGMLHMYGSDYYPLSLEGTSFDDLVDRLRQHLGGASKGDS